MAIDVECLKKAAKEIAEMVLKKGQELAATGVKGAFSSAKEMTKKKPPGEKKPPGFSVVGTRPMKFPYTFTAKIIQFPWVYYVKNNWVYRYYFISIFVCIPIFKKISNLSNSPGNVKKWEEIKRKEREAEHH